VTAASLAKKLRTLETSCMGLVLWGESELQAVMQFLDVHRIEMSCY
jgi:hypothetical protein